MPQKKSVKKTTPKRKTSRRTRKTKVYIPTYKIIGFCAFIITICVGLLLITTLASPKPDSISHKTEQKTSVEKTVKETKKETKPVEATKKTPSPSDKTDNPPAREIENPYIEKDVSQNKKIQNPQEDKSVKTVETSNKNTNNSIKNNDNKNNSVTEKPSAPSAKKSKYNFPKAKNGAQLIFVFDDGGQNNAQLEKYLTLPFPITVAVLPQLQNSASAAQKVRASGNEVILHQPMQAINASVNPGPGAIKPEMSDEEIKSVLFQNINQLGQIAGMNNHEGSAITADAEKMAVILQMASEEGIYFLDSRTNVDTKVPYVAKEMGYGYYERNIFLDNEKTKDNVLKELKKGLDIANKNGNVIMIGHVWSADFLPALLNDMYPELKENGYTFSVVSKSKARK